MNCETCGRPDTAVIDSRRTAGGELVRRRRRCERCGSRFTTLEVGPGLIAEVRALVAAQQAELADLRGRNAALVRAVADESARSRPAGSWHAGGAAPRPRQVA